MRAQSTVSATMTDKVLLTVKEAAALMSISPSQAYELVARGVVPSIRLGARSIRVPHASLVKWANSLRPEASVEESA